ncbi:unnamed protein product [Urochloa humidicola]
MSTGRGRGFDSTREEANGRSRDHPAPRIRVAGHETPRRSASATATRPPDSASALAVRPQPRHTAPRAGCWSRRPTCGIYSGLPRRQYQPRRRASTRGPGAAPCSSEDAEPLLAFCVEDLTVSLARDSSRLSWCGSSHRARSAYRADDATSIPMRHGLGGRLEAHARASRGQQLQRPYAVRALPRCCLLSRFLRRVATGDGRWRCVVAAARPCLGSAQEASGRWMR